MVFRVFGGRKKGCLFPADSLLDLEVFSCVGDIFRSASVYYRTVPGAGSGKALLAEPGTAASGQSLLL